MYFTKTKLPGCPIASCIGQLFLFNREAKKENTTAGYSVYRGKNDFRGEDAQQI